MEGRVGLAQPGFSGGGGGDTRGDDKDGGAGGGGFGGGEAGDAGGGTGRSGGGGGGGSWARQATVDDSEVPALGAANPPTTDSGAVVFTFDLCAVYPEEFGCE